MGPVTAVGVLEAQRAFRVDAREFWPVCLSEFEENIPKWGQPVGVEGLCFGLGGV